MHRRQFSGARNKLDLNDRVQVRILRKRLKVSHEQLAGLVRTAGDSIAGVSKEAGDRRRLGAWPNMRDWSRMPPTEPSLTRPDAVSKSMSPPPPLADLVSRKAYCGQVR